MSDAIQNRLLLRRAIEAIYETALSPERWPETLSVISECFDAEGTLLLFQHADGRFDAVTSPGVLHDLRAQFIAEDWSHRDLRAIRSHAAGVFGSTHTITDQDLATPEEIETHPYYTQLLAPHGLGWFLGASVSPDPGVSVAFSVQRLKRKPIFNDDDRTRLMLLARHAERSLRLSTRVLQAELSNVALGDVLERVVGGVLLLNDGGHVMYSNAAGRSLLDEHRLGGGTALVGPSVAMLQALKEQIASVLAMPFGAEPDAGKPILLKSADGEGPTVAYVLPVAAGTKRTLASLGANVSAIVLVLQQDAQAPVEPSIVRDILGLTLGEARVASLVGVGRSPREAADTLGISEETARTVLKRVYAKTNISKQSQLAVLLTRLTLKGT